MIIPTVGRVVYFRPGEADRNIMTVFGDQPLRADIVYVQDDGTVNLKINDHVGVAHFRSNMPLIQDGETPPADRSYCEWMIAPTLHAAGTPHVSTKGTDLDSH